MDVETAEAATCAVPDEAEKVFKFYEEELVKAGWKIDTSVSWEAGHNINANKEDAGDLALYLADESDYAGYPTMHITLFIKYTVG
ncbi:MAG: hypothetical protein U1B80_06365 [Anaerolineaceae bacterium]|nr:hypothetical protein [Anaerolineaceae bacterium]